MSLHCTPPDMQTFGLDDVLEDHARCLNDQARLPNKQRVPAGRNEVSAEMSSSTSTHVVHCEKGQRGEEIMEQLSVRVGQKQG